MSWREYRLVYGKGARDTRRGREGDYATITLEEVFERRPTAMAKPEAEWVIASSYAKPDARSHSAQRASGLFVALVGDIDSGNHSADDIDALIVDFFGDGVAARIYSTSSATADNRKWRIIIALAHPQPFAVWRRFQCAFYDFMEANGVVMDRALLRPGQVFYLPNVAPDMREGGNATGEPLFYDSAASRLDGRGVTPKCGLAPEWIARVADEAQEQAAALRAERPRSGPIAAYNASNPLSDVLLSCGYKPSPSGGGHWRSPHQTSDTYATRVYQRDDSSEFWVSLSGSDDEAGIGAKAASGCRYGDAFALNVHFNHGGDFSAALRALPHPPPDTGRYHLMSAVEVAQWPPIQWIVRGIFPAEGLVAIYGAPGSGKSFVALDILGAIARGIPWFGNKSYRRPVTYVALEGEAGIAQRVRAYEKHNGALPLNVYFIAQPLNLLSQQDVTDLGAAIIANMGSGGVICIDTLNRASAGADENDSRDMGRIIESAKQLQRATGGLIILVHHSGKDATKGLRGHSSLVAALDAAIEVTKTEVQRSWKITKSKDGRDDKFSAFHLEIIDLGVDSEGEAINSCIVMPSDDPVRSTKSLTPQQQQGVDAYRRVAEQHGIWQGSQFKGVTTEKWRDEFYRTSTSDTADGKRKAFKRLRDTLTKLGILAVDGEINLLAAPATRSLTPPFGGIADAFAEVLMQDSGTVTGQSRDKSPDR